MTTISEILGTDDDWRSIEYRAERIEHGWRCRQTDDRYATMREETTSTKREARGLLHEWGATKLDECPAL